ncbi:acetate--CoA ligase family protein [Chloroflexota bacterium]
MSKWEELERLFNPSSIAVIGASNELYKGGGRFYKGLMHSGFKGSLYAVNPNESVVFGQKSYSTVRDIQGDIDLAIIAVPAIVVPRVMSDCSQKRVKFAIVHSAGFSELGPEGKELEKEMLKFAREGGIRIIGPNCMGIYSASAHINTIVEQAASGDESGTMAFVGQSGWVTENIISLGHERGLRFSKVVSIGNQSDITIEDLVDYFAGDMQTLVVAFYAEGIKYGRDFIKIVRRVSKKKPVIVWKGGRTAGGARAASSHTGSLAGNATIMDTALTQCGATIARDLDDLIDLMVGFSSPVLPQGNRVGLLVEAGGGAVSGCDAAETMGLYIPQLSAQAQNDIAATLKGIIPPFATPLNPVDVVWAPAQNATPLFVNCARVMLRELDAIVILNYLNYDEDFAKAMTGVRNEAGKPIMVIPGHMAEQRSGMALLTRKGIPAFATPGRVMKVLSAMVKYEKRRQEV